MSTGTEEVENYIGSLENSENGSEEMNGGSDEGSPVGFDPKAFQDLASAVTGIQNLMGKFGHELGGLKQSLASSNAPAPAAPEGSSDQSSDALAKFMDDPQQFIADIAMNANTQQQQNQQQQVTAVRQALINDAPDFGDYEDDIIDLIVSDHKGAVDKRAVTNDLYSLGTPALLNAYHRAKNAKELTSANNLIEILKGQGVNIDDAKRALTKNHSSGDSFQPPERNQAPNVAARDIPSDQRKAILAKLGVKV